MNILTNTTLKIIAMMLMVLDHIYTYIGLNTGLEIPIWFGYLGKLSAPIFFYLVVEGFHYTRNRKNYLKRLFGMGLFMMGVNIVLDIPNNIFLSLGFGVLMMCFIESIKHTKDNRLQQLLNIVGAIASGLIIALFTEGNFFALGMILIFYGLREKKTLMALVYIIFSLFWLITSVGSGFLESAFQFDYQWMMVFAILPILLYNGKLGISNKYMKWIFYWFYPIHLIIIVSLSNVISSSNPAFPLEVNHNLLNEVVHEIDADVTYKTNTKFEVRLSDHPKGVESVYLIELYEEDTRLGIASNIVEINKNSKTIKQTFKVLPSANISKDKDYVLVVRDLNADQILFEDILILK